MTTRAEAYECYNLWLEDFLKRYSFECCIPTIQLEDESPPPLSSAPVEIFSEKAIKRLSGGPPPRGKPKPPADPAPVSLYETEAIHRAMAASRR